MIPHLYSLTRKTIHPAICFLVILTFAGGCGKKTPPDLTAAKEALEKAEIVGASKRAPELFGKATGSLDNAKDLIVKKKMKDAGLQAKESLSNSRLAYEKAGPAYAEEGLDKALRKRKEAIEAAAPFLSPLVYSNALNFENKAERELEAKDYLKSRENSDEAVRLYEKSINKSKEAIGKLSALIEDTRNLISQGREKDKEYGFIETELDQAGKVLDEGVEAKNEKKYGPAFQKVNEALSLTQAALRELDKKLKERLRRKYIKLKNTYDKLRGNYETQKSR